ncbi:FIST signal transduction protein [Robiginitalea sp.]|uniref:FIST signal transduction protein n=1 Tax=Robiginitalea sp. TaxID=1902411 RepID=UPI003C736508
MNAKTITVKTPEALQAALEAAAAEGFNPTLGVVFAPSGFETQSLAEVLDSHGIAIFGAQTPDKFTDRGMENELATLLLTDLDPAYFRIVLKSLPPEDFKGGVAVAAEVARMGKAWFSRPAFILCVSDFSVPGEALAEGILEGAGPETPVMGGFSGGKPYSHDHVVFTNKEQSRQGLVCLILDQEHVAIQGLAVSGWKPAGAVKTVTKSQGNWVYTIDGEPALNVLLRFTGAQVDLDDGEDLLRQIGNSHPLQVMNSEGSPVMKPPLMFNRETGAVMCGGHIPEGAKIRFSLPPDFDIVETVVESAREAKERAMPEADALLIFSCIGRQVTLGPLIDEEINGLNDVWKVPMTGYFSLGEFGATEGGKPTFHGTTCSWVALKEK